MFDPSIVVSKKIIKHTDIENIDVSSYPLVLKVGAELIFVSIELEDNLIEFAKTNNIPIIKRPNIWGKILEPFLDLQFDKKNLKPINIELSKYGLTYQLVTKLRRKVAMQILKYNFDLHLYIDCFFVVDVLCVMRTKLNKKEYKLFYQKVMEIALIESTPTDVIDQR